MTTAEKLFAEVVDLLQGECIGDVAERAGVSHTTLFRWRCGRTKYPQLRTVIAVAEACGCTLALVRQAKARLRRVA